MALKLDGKLVSEKIKSDIKLEIEQLKQQGRRIPCLAVILVGDNPASQVYVRNKIKACEKTGILSRQYHLDADCQSEEVFNLINRLNEDLDVDGILCQLPLPPHIDEEQVLQLISPDKDVDGFHPVNAGKLFLGLSGVLPCTPAGVMTLLDNYNYDYEGKRAVIVGRSNIVGKPLAHLLLQKNCTVTIAHSHTADLPKLCREADLLIAAAGRLNLIDKEFVNDRQYIVDVSINRNEEGKVRGDVVTAEVEPLVAALTPVPGGVGPMTIAMLLKNTLQLYREHQHED